MKALRCNWNCEFVSRCLVSKYTLKFTASLHSHLQIYLFANSIASVGWVVRSVGGGGRGVSDFTKQVLMQMIGRSKT